MLYALIATPTLRALVLNVEMSPSILLDRQLARLADIGLTLIRHRRLTAGHAGPIELGTQAPEDLADRLAFVRPPFDLGNIAASADAFEAGLNVLADLERKTERVRSGLLSSAEARTAEHLATPIREHFDAYLSVLAAAGSVPMHRSNVKTYLNRLAADCGFSRLADLKREALEKWLVRESKNGRSARSRNTHRASLVVFANWCSDPSIGRLVS